VPNDEATLHGPLTASVDQQPGSNDWRVRTASALVMAAMALTTAWAGGIVFALFWCAAAVIVFWEWRGIVRSSPNRLLWIAAGAGYAAVLAAAPPLLRFDPSYGLSAIIFVFVIVWSTDIFGYVVGRLIGGPKLLPAVSPKKTWSGAIGGTLGAIAGAGVAAVVFDAALPAMLGLAVCLSIASQAGDLLESAVKRKFEIKDASHIIPGHGGVMDRVDGFIVACGFAAIIGVARGGWSHAGQGLLVW
jgi:phosphatidate cytidylyltransferase